jgi:hypothetical protein
LNSYKKIKKVKIQSKKRKIFYFQVAVYKKANEALLEELIESKNNPKKSNYRPLDCGENAPVITRMHKFSKSQQNRIRYEIYMKAVDNITTVYGNIGKEELETRAEKEADKLMKLFLENKLDVPSAVSRADITD